MSCSLSLGAVFTATSTSKSLVLQVNKLTATMNGPPTPASFQQASQFLQITVPRTLLSSLVMWGPPLRIPRSVQLTIPKSLRNAERQTPCISGVWYNIHAHRLLLTIGICPRGMPVVCLSLLCLETLAKIIHHTTLLCPTRPFVILYVDIQISS